MVEIVLKVLYVLVCFFLIGVGPDRRLTIQTRNFPRCMGLGTGPGGTLWMSSLYQLWRFENFLDPGQTRNGHDAVFAPVTGHSTGDIDIQLWEKGKLNSMPSAPQAPR